MRSLAPLLAAGLLIACGTEAEDLPRDAESDTPTADTRTADTPSSDVGAGPDPGDAPIADVPRPDVPATDAGGPSWTACEINSECVLAANTCCGVCGQAQLGDVDPINASARDAHYASVCDDPDPICPGCPSQVNPWIGATCDTATCAEFDLRTEPITECATDDECVLRVTGCCECGGDTIPEALISIRGDSVAEYTSRVCDPDATCPGCAPEYPGWVEPACQDGRCTVYYLPD